MAVSDNQITVDVLNHLDFEGDREYKVNYRIGRLEWLDLYSPVTTPIPHDLAALEIWRD